MRERRERGWRMVPNCVGLFHPPGGTIRRLRVTRVLVLVLSAASVHGLCHGLCKPKRLRRPPNIDRKPGAFG